MVRRRTDVFISYSHADRRWLKRFQVMLKPLVRRGDIVLWDDTKIRPGDQWRDEIRKALESASVALLLVTPDFLASDFIFEHELPPLLAAARRGGLRVLWAAVSASMYSVTEIAEYQAVNDPARPLDSLNGAARNRTLVEIAQEVQKAMEDPKFDTHIQDSPRFQVPGKTVEVVSELYRRMVAAERAFATAMMPLRSGPSIEAIDRQKDEDMKAAVLAGNAFLDYFRDNRIWLSGPISDSVENLAQIFVEAWNQYNDDDQPGRFRRKGDAWRRILNDVPMRRREIEDAMRTVLGT
ncbi:MAG TPA: toll/interleukin-1 receptor domain-containing protein [Chloroflexota bacterium]|nr:toll/interleukin-1 receptor domain-containing protein [Chloroflexota bacterium]